MSDCNVNEIMAAAGCYACLTPEQLEVIQTELLCRIYTNGGGGGTPGGLDGQVQFNDGGAFGGDAGLTYNKTTNLLTAGDLAISSLTAGSVLFAGAAGAVAQDNANLFWDDTNNRLGIGTNAPPVTLSIMRDTVATDNSQMFIIQNRSDAGFPYVGFDLQFRTDGGAVNEGGAYISFSNFKTGVQDTAAVIQWDWNSTDANKFTIENRKDGPMRFLTNALERMRIDGSGNVRIGASGTISSHFLIQNTAAGDIGQIIKLAATPTGDAFRVTSSADAILTVIDASGNVGIGIAIPTVKLEVSSAGASPGNIAQLFAPGLTVNSNVSFGVGKAAASNDSAAFGFNGSATGNAYIVVYGDNPSAGTGLKVYKGGNVSIGDTSASATLHIKNALAADIGQIIKLAAVPTGDAFRVTSSADAVLMRVTNTGEMFSVASITGGQINSSLGYLGLGPAQQVYLYSNTSGILRLTNAAETDFVRLQLGGDSNLFPAVARSTTEVHIKLADNSALTTLAAGTIKVGGSATINQVTKILQGSDTHDFASVAAGTESAIRTVTITGAAAGDPVFIGLPDAASTPNISWTVWVSAANTVSYKFYNRNTVAAVDLGNLTYKFFVHQL